ncbi:hypothetical protein AB0F81_31200 [Actinoplanes sp. NPDC024001]|uniref:WD40 repeat domain-containing protein n=1 Tax=Actinoplanes sp. NPDC024001 TaxID=3154598 RepID=UPI0033E85BBC
MTELERTVRAAVNDLAQQAPPALDLATAARVRGRRIRRRRQALVGLAAAVLVGTVITPYAVLNDRRSAPEPALVTTPPPAPSVEPATTVPYVRAGGVKWWKSPIELPGDLAVTSVSRRGVVMDENGQDVPAAATFKEGNVVLDRDAGRYRVLPSGYQHFEAAPTGRYVLVENEAAKVGIADASTGRVRMLDHGSGGGVQWSPDGKTLLLTLNAGGFRLIDAATATRRDHSIPESNALCPDFCSFTWLPNGKEVALAQRDPAVPQSEDRPDTVRSIKIYSVDTGQLVREIPVPGVPVGSTAWSPDGRYVLLRPDASEPNGTRIAEVETGRIVGTIPGEPRVYVHESNQIFTIDGIQVGLYNVSGRLQARIALPDDFARREAFIGRR